MRERRVSLALAAVVAASLAAAAVMAAGSSGRGAPGALPLAKTGGEMPAALDRHLDQARQNDSRKRWGAGWRVAFCRRQGLGRYAGVHRACIPEEGRPAIEHSGRTAGVQGGRSARPGPREPRVDTGRPETATYQFTPLRRAVDYVPNEYAAGGRTTTWRSIQLRRHGREQLPDVDHARRRRRLAHEERAHRTTEAGVPLRAFRHQLDRLRSPSTRTTRRANTIWVGTGEANTCGSGCVAGVGPLQVDRRRRHWAGPSATRRSRARGVGAIAVKPAIPTRSTRHRRGAPRPCRRSAARRSAGRCPGRTAVGPVQVRRTAARPGRFIHNGAARPRPLHRRPTESQQRRRPARRAACAASRSTRRTRHRLRGLVRARRLALERRRRDVDADQAVAERGRSSRRGPTIAVTTLPNGKTRMYVGEGNTERNPVQPVLPQRRRRDAARPSSRSCRAASTAQPRATRTYNFCTRPVLVRQLRLHPGGHPDIVYVGGSYQYGEAVVSNSRAVVLSTDAGATCTDMTYDATDTVHPNGLHPDQHLLVTNPDDPLQFFEAIDGGVMRSSGQFVDTLVATATPAGLAEPYLTPAASSCSRASRRELECMNKGLSTLQFQSLSVSPFDPNSSRAGRRTTGRGRTGPEHEWRER